MDARIGELAALGTALCWTVTALSFEAAGKRIGSLTVNIIRLVMAAALFALYGWIVRGIAIPLDASAYAWTWLGLSGLVGFVIGDLFLFQAFVDIGARVSMLIYSSVPPLTALMARFVLDERLTPQGIVGMALTVLGIAIVVLRRPA
ncbi:MAG: DMT family transporter, partial [Spirochaetota bacterium]